MGSRLSMVLVIVLAIVVLSSCTKQDPSYCVQSSDCVRVTTCCDCGLGTWVNKERVNDIPQLQCTDKCKCAFREAIGACENNACVGKLKELS